MIVNGVLDRVGQLPVSLMIVNVNFLTVKETEGLGFMGGSRIGVDGEDKGVILVFKSFVDEC